MGGLRLLIFRVSMESYILFSAIWSGSGWQYLPVFLFLSRLTVIQEWFILLLWPHFSLQSSRIFCRLSGHKFLNPVFIMESFFFRKTGVFARSGVILVVIFQTLKVIISSPLDSKSFSCQMSYCSGRSPFTCESVFLLLLSRLV